MRRKVLAVSAMSHIGLCKKENQDCVWARIGEDAQGDFGLFVVADGMGGHKGGLQAAQTAVQVCEDWWNGIMPRLMGGNEAEIHQRVLASLVGVVYHVNEAVIGLGETIGSNPGTTFSALFLYGGRYSFVHVGDSRIYQVGNQLIQLTSDDTWVAQQVRSGSMTEEAALKHPNRHMLVQCVGAGPHIQVHQGTGQAQAGIGFVLCSDGFYNHLHPDEITSLCWDANIMESRIHKLKDVVLQRGASDNLTAIGIKCLVDGQ